MHLVLIILIAVFMFGFMIFFHELGHFTMAKLGGIRVNEFAIGFGPKVLKKKRRETTYSLRLLPLGGFVSMEGEDEDSKEIGSFSNAPISNRIAVIIAGSVMNLTLGFIVLFCLTATGDGIASTTIHSFYDGASSKASGLMEDDEIIAINGRRLFVADDIVYELQRVSADGEASVTVLRNGEKKELNVKFDTEYDEQSGQNSIIFDFKVYGREMTFSNILRESCNWTLSIGRLIFVSLVDLITGNAAINQLAGPVGIVGEISEAASYGVSSVMYLFAIICINLGICNLLPLPALDGGRLVFLIVEALTKKKLNPKYEGMIHLVGFLLLLVLMVVVTYNDVTRLL